MTNIQLVMDLASISKLPNLPPRMDCAGRVKLSRQIKGFLVEGFLFAIAFYSYHLCYSFFFFFLISKMNNK